jgi:arginyl-tRNA synthetase
MLPTEVKLLELVANFPAEVELSASEYKPLRLTNYLFELARAFSNFYRDCPVLKANPITRQARLGLVAIAKQTLANGLRLLGIAAPEYM